MHTDAIPDNGNITVINLRSTLRIGDVAEFKQEADALLAAAPDKPVVCDARAVEFIDAAALQLLVAMGQACAGQRRDFTIGAASAAFVSAATVAGYATPLGLAH